MRKTLYVMLFGLAGLAESAGCINDGEIEFSRPRDEDRTYLEHNYSNGPKAEPGIAWRYKFR